MANVIYRGCSKDWKSSKFKFYPVKIDLLNPPRKFSKTNKKNTTSVKDKEKRKIILGKNDKVLKKKEETEANKMAQELLDLAEKETDMVSFDDMDLEKIFSGIDNKKLQSMIKEYADDVHQTIKLACTLIRYNKHLPPGTAASLKNPSKTSSNRDQVKIIAMCRTTAFLSLMKKLMLAFNVFEGNQLNTMTEKLASHYFGISENQPLPVKLFLEGNKGIDVNLWNKSKNESKQPRQRQGKSERKKHPVIRRRSKIQTSGGNKRNQSLQ